MRVVDCAGPGNALDTDVLFSLYDEDKNGTIDQYELHQMLRLIHAGPEFQRAWRDVKLEEAAQLTAEERCAEQAVKEAVKRAMEAGDVEAMAEAERGMIEFESAREAGRWRPVGEFQQHDWDRTEFHSLLHRLMEKSSVVDNKVQRWF